MRRVFDISSLSCLSGSSFILSFGMFHFTDSTPNQTTLKQEPGRNHRTSTGGETLEGISITIEKAAEVSQTKNWNATRQ